jgi:hypothetical protein
MRRRARGLRIPRAPPRSRSGERQAAPRREHSVVDRPPLQPRPPPVARTGSRRAVGGDYWDFPPEVSELETSVRDY